MLLLLLLLHSGPFCLCDVQGGSEKTKEAGVELSK